MKLTDDLLGPQRLSEDSTSGPSLGEDCAPTAASVGADVYESSRVYETPVGPTAALLQYVHNKHAHV